MLEWLGGEGDRLREAFTATFGQRCRAFGNRATSIGGVSDDAKGVQWNASYDPRDQRKWVSVNLEGMAYDGWPVARLIRRELARPKLLDVVMSRTSATPIEVRWRRDYWQVHARPAIREAEIAPTPLLVSELTERSWQQALEGAQECLDVRPDRVGRAVQRVTLLGSAQEVSGQVSPHLTLTVYPVSTKPWLEVLEHAKSLLQPYYEWATEQAR